MKPLSFGQKWAGSAFYAVLISAIIALQVEVRNLVTELGKVRADGASAAAAVAKFERDFFAKERAEENARVTAQAAGDAARRQNIDQGLKALPYQNFRAPVYWNGKPPDEHK